MSASDDNLITKMVEIKMQIDRGELQASVVQITSLLPSEELSQELRRCLFALRANVHAQLGDLHAAIDDFDAALKLPLIRPSMDAASTASILLSRAGVRSRIGDCMGAIDDYTSVSATPDATPVDKAVALWKRGMTKGAEQDFSGAHGDLLAVLSLPETTDIGPIKLKAAEALIADGVLHRAAGRGNIDKVARIVAAGGDPSAADDNQTTPLHFAAAHGNTAVAEFLLKHGANPELRDINGDRAVDVARATGNSDMHRLLGANSR